MGAVQKYKAAEVAEAITRAKGILASAAQSLGCTRQTISNYIDRYATVKDAFDEANETTIDYVESQLLKQIAAGQTASTIFFLKTKAKHRGYIERQEMAGVEDAPLVPIVQIYIPDNARDDDKGRG